MNIKIIVVIVGSILLVGIAGYYFVNPPHVIAPELQNNQTLTGVYWWQETTADNGAIVAPNKIGEFSIEFSEDLVLLKTDCNSGRASFSVTNDRKFMIWDIAQTRMGCGDTMEMEYFSMLSDAVSYRTVEDNTLILVLNDGREMHFVAEY